MDLNQRKLTANEWNSIEKPRTEDELRIVNMIKDAWEDVTFWAWSRMRMIGNAFSSSCPRKTLSKDTCGIECFLSASC